MKEEEKNEIEQMSPLEAYESGKDFAYKRAVESCEENTTAFQVKDDIENILRKPELYE